MLAPCRLVRRAVDADVGRLHRALEEARDLAVEGAGASDAPSLPNTIEFSSASDVALRTLPRSPRCCRSATRRDPRADRGDVAFDRRVLDPELGVAAGQRTDRRRRSPGSARRAAGPAPRSPARPRGLPAATRLRAVNGTVAEALVGQPATRAGVLGGDLVADERVAGRHASRAPRCTRRAAPDAVAAVDRVALEEVVALGELRRPDEPRVRLSKQVSPRRRPARRRSSSASDMRRSRCR